MNNKIRNTFIVIKSEIINNILTIKKLLEETNILTNIINTIDEKNKNLREKLTKNTKKMYDTIDLLISQTNNLFDLYKQLAEITSEITKIN